MRYDGEIRRIGKLVGQCPDLTAENIRKGILALEDRQSEPPRRWSPRRLIWRFRTWRAVRRIMRTEESTFTIWWDDRQ